MTVIFMHVVIFVGAGGRPFDESISSDVKTFVHTVLHYKGIKSVLVCVQPDHVHMLIQVPNTVNVLSSLETLRYWLLDFVERRSSQPMFVWDERMWIVSKSPSDVPAMEKYFRRQQLYHVACSIEQEWQDMLDMEEIEQESCLTVFQ